jgi:hypothetical protein
LVSLKPLHTLSVAIDVCLTLAVANSLTQIVLSRVILLIPEGESRVLLLILILSGPPLVSLLLSAFRWNRQVAEYDHLFLSLLVVPERVELPEESLCLLAVALVLEGSLLHPSLLLLHLLPHLHDVRVQLRRVVLEYQVQCHLHLLHEETVQVGLELVSLLGGLRLAAYRLLVLFDGETDHTLLQLVSQHSVPGGGVELGQELLLPLLSLLSHLSRIVICRR